MLTGLSSWHTLQVDLAFWPEAEFGPIAPTFRLLIGTAHERPHLPAPQGRGMDRSPADVTSGLVVALVRSLDPAELWCAFGVACDRLLAEVDAVAPDLARRLLRPIRQLSVARTTDARD